MGYYIVQVAAWSFWNERTSFLSHFFVLFLCKTEVDLKGGEREWKKKMRFSFFEKKRNRSQWPHFSIFTHLFFWIEKRFYAKTVKFAIFACCLDPESA